MKKILTITLFTLLLSLILVPSNSKAQFRDYPVKIGLQGSYLMPWNEYSRDGFSGMARVFARFQIAKDFHLAAGVGYGTWQGLDYIKNDYFTKFIPIDLRLLYTPFELKTWNPYVFIGGGVAAWWLADSPASPKYPPSDELTGIAPLVESGIGTELALSKNWVLDFNAGFNFFAADDANGVATTSGDAFLDNFDRYVNLTLGIAFIPESCENDNDNDGLTKCEEDKIGTDPNKADTDGDGLKDGEELKKYNTDPKNADSDGDGLKDGEEVKNYETNPNKADTDDDGLKDGEEVTSYKTDPKKADTDGDGLNDGEEVNKYKTDPNKKDTDGDGLKDGDEVKIHKTDPLVSDTDKGSINDGEEVNRGTNPLDPKDDIKVVETAKESKMEIPKFDPILFAYNSSKIQKSEEKTLSAAYKFLISNEDVLLVIKGHTDSKGSATYNKKLSEARANATKAWLVAKGIDGKRISTEGLGSEKPVASNDSDAGRQQNRRAELIISE